MQSVLFWLHNGGPFVVPLGVLGAISLLLLFERINFIVVRSSIHTRPFIERVVSLVRAGDVDEALRVCAAHHAALPDLGLLILRSRSADEGELHGIAESAAHTLVPALTRRVAWLPPLAGIMLLLGAIGSLVNLHDALLRATPWPAAVAYAVRPLTIAMVLMIPIVAGHAYLKGEAQKLATQLDEFGLRLIDALVDRPDVRLGHRG